MAESKTEHSSFASEDDSTVVEYPLTPELSEFYQMVRMNQVELVDAYLSDHPAIVFENPWPINYAAEMGHAPMLAKLLRSGFTVSQQSISYAINGGNIDIAVQLSRYLSGHWNRYYYLTTVEVLVYRGHISELRKLATILSFQVCPYVLECAIRGNNLDIVRWLLEEYGANYKKLTGYMYDALMCRNKYIMDTICNFLGTAVVPKMSDMAYFCLRRNLLIGLSWVMDKGYQLSQVDVKTAEESYYPRNAVWIRRRIASASA